MRKVLEDAFLGLLLITLLVLWGLTFLQECASRSMLDHFSPAGLEPYRSSPGRGLDEDPDPQAGVTPASQIRVSTPGGGLDLDPFSH